MTGAAATAATGDSAAASTPSTGTWVFVCGPSGSGKDSVIRWAQQALQDRIDIVFSRRYITRAVHTGSDHDPVSHADFEKLLQSGALRWHWTAHGFSYGIGQHYQGDSDAGKVVVINGSREHVQELFGSPHLRVVQITADSTALVQRLKARGRDTAEAVVQRLERNTAFRDLACDLLIANDTRPAHAGRQLSDYLVSAAAEMETDVGLVTAKRAFSSSAS